MTAVRGASDAAGLGRSQGGRLRHPRLLLIGVFLVFPALWTLYLGITDYRLTGVAAAQPKFVGSRQLHRRAVDPAFRNSLWLTLAFVFGSAIIGQTVLGLR